MRQSITIIDKSKLIREKRARIAMYSDELKQLHEFVKTKGLSLSAFVNILIKENEEYIQWRKNNNYEQLK